MLVEPGARPDTAVVDPEVHRLAQVRRPPERRVIEVADQSALLDLVAAQGIVQPPDGGSGDPRRLGDSGVRRGTDIAIALALGASAVLIGRPYLYGLGAGGEQGVSAVIGMLCDELRRAMQLLGVSSVAELRREGPGLVRRVARPETADLPVA